MRSVLTLGMAALTLGGVGCWGGGGSPDSAANAGPPTTINVKLPPGDKGGKRLVMQSGCLACHKIGNSGDGRLGPNLTHIAARESRASILGTLKAGPGIMPSFKNLGKGELSRMASYLAHLK
jgi:menaquinol-cytochrome c reductase cytochrome b/c subunit